MRAVVCKELGDPERLTVEQVPTVPCGPGEVRVRIWACGVNYVDALFVQGRYQIKPAVPFTPGSEISGELTEIGAEVDGWAIGDRVISSIGLGGFADEIVIEPARLLPLPDRLTFGQGATMFQSYATAWFTLTRRTSIVAGDWVGTLGAAGGVGLAMIDVARSLGASTLAAVSNPERARLCIERGAHSVIDYSAEDLKTRVRELTDGGADVMIDPGGRTAGRRGVAFAGRERPAHGGRLRVRHDPGPAGEPDPLAEPPGHRRRLGGVGAGQRRGERRARWPR